MLLRLTAIRLPIINCHQNNHRRSYSLFILRLWDRESSVQRPERGSTTDAPTCTVWEWESSRNGNFGERKMRNGCAPADMCWSRIWPLWVELGASKNCWDGALRFCDLAWLTTYKYAPPRYLYESVRLKSNGSSLTTEIQLKYLTPPRPAFQSHSRSSEPTWIDRLPMTSR